MMPDRKQPNIGEQGGGDPMDLFVNHEEAQSFIRALREKVLEGFSHTDIAVTSKVYAVFDLASSGAYIADQVTVMQKAAGPSER